MAVFGKTDVDDMLVAVVTDPSTRRGFVSEGNSGRGDIGSVAGDNAAVVDAHMVIIRILELFVLERVEFNPSFCWFWQKTV